MAKKVDRIIKLNVAAGKATPSPPIGPALGQAGVNIMEFCKAFNAATQNQEIGVKLPTVITVYSDRSFTFVVKKATTTHFIQKAIGLEKGAALPGRGFVSKITTSQIRKIAEEKMVDMNANTVEAAMEMVKGSARAMGVQVVED